MSDETENSGAINGPALVPQEHGGAILSGGKPGNKGGTGRPSDEFTEQMRRLSSRKKNQAYLKKCLAGEFGPKFYLQALQYTTDRGYGKSAQPVELTTPQPLRIIVTRE